MNNSAQLPDAVIDKKSKKARLLRLSCSNVSASKQLKLREKLQKYNFKKLASCSNYATEKRRLLALAYIKEGKSILEVSHAVKVSYGSVYVWVRKFSKKKLRGLKRKTRKKVKLKACDSRKKEFQKYDFQQLASNTINQKEKKYFLALAYLKEGKSILEITDTLKVCTTSIYKWIKQFDKNKLQGLKKSKIDQLMLEIQNHDFEQLANFAISPREKKRLLALSYLKKGKGTQEVANTLKVSRPAIYNWIKKFNKNGLNGLKEKALINRVLQ